MNGNMSENKSPKVRLGRLSKSPEPRKTGRNDPKVNKTHPVLDNVLALLERYDEHVAAIPVIFR